MLAGPQRFQALFRVDGNGGVDVDRIDVRILRIMFVIVLGWTALQMARRALGI